MTKLEGFMRLIDRYKFPLIKMNGKEPLEKTWQSICFREFEEIRFHRNHNAGVVCGNSSGLIVLDIDDSMAFSRTGYEIPDTFTVKSGMKGFHHYFCLPDTEAYKSKSFQKMGFDIRANGGCIVAPYSIHPETGNRYKIISEIPIATAPSWLLDLSLERKSQTTSSGDSLDEYEDLDLDISEEIIDRYQQMLSTSVEKGQRSEHIWRVLHGLVGCANLKLTSKAG